jgi:hypothetical protein
VDVIEEEIIAPQGAPASSAQRVALGRAVSHFKEELEDGSLNSVRLEFVKAGRLPCSLEDELITAHHNADFTQSTYNITTEEIEANR